MRKRTKSTIKHAIKIVICMLLVIVTSITFVACSDSTDTSIFIGDNGNWYINGEDTGVSATGPQGEQGEKGEKGDQGEPGVSATTGDITYEVDSDIVESLVEITSGSPTGSGVTDGKYYVDYASLSEEQIAARELSVEIASEGFVLLKNENDALPFGNDVKAVSLFGIHSTSLISSTSGSAAGSTGNNGIEETTLPEAMETAGYRVNSTLVSFYEKHNNLGTTSTYELAISEYTSPLISTYSGFNDAAIITISRQGSEGYDKSASNVDGHSDPTDHELMLEDNEKDLIEHVKQYFDKVVVLINSSNIMQIPELASSSRYSVDAIIWVGNTGNNGIEAVGSILNGSVTPSGKTVDIWEKDFSTGPTWTNFGTQEQNGLDAYIYDTDGNDTGYRTVEYREGIYLGYKYYETAAYDMNAESSGTGDEWYDDMILYPFGYGLSYTTFEWEFNNVAETGIIDAANRTITIRVRVTNTGDYAGKDVVQIYFSAPYYNGGIEKASTNLVGFAKTDLLQPGESQTVTIQFTAQDMASYDWNDANGNGNTGYELESGDYVIMACTDSHTPVLSVTRTVEETIECDTDLTTGQEIDNVFVGDYTSVNDTLLDNMISRADGGLVQPAPASVSDRTYSDGEIALLDDQYSYRSSMDEDIDPWYVEVTPTSWDQASSSGGTAEIQITDMIGIDYSLVIKDGQVIEGTDEGSQKWQQFMNQLTWEELVSLVNNGGGTTEIASVGVRSISAVETPLQISGGTLWVSVPIISATWNQELAYEYGVMIGNEALFNGITYWQGPAMNIHRSPLSGRNVEYWSQDGVQAALMVSQAVKGVTSKGVTCFLKHMVLNDQEYYRDTQGGLLTWATEQVIREIYLRPFEASLKEGGATGIMTSFNRIGYINSQLNYALLVDLVRYEWQSKAIVETDAWQGQYCPLDLMVRAGGNQVLGSGSDLPSMGIETGEWNAEEQVVYVSDGGSGYIPSYTHYANIRVRAQEILYNYVNSNGIQNGYSTVEATVTFDYLCEQSVAITFEGMDASSFSLSDGSMLPDGLTLDSSGILSGKLSDYEYNGYVFYVDVMVDNYLEMTLPVTIEVLQPIHAEGDLEVDVDEQIDITFSSDYYEYGSLVSLDDSYLELYEYDVGTRGTMIFNWYEIDENYTGTPSYPLDLYPDAGYMHSTDAESSDTLFLPEGDIEDELYAAAHEYTYEVVIYDPDGNVIYDSTDPDEYASSTIKAELIPVTHTGTKGDSYEIVDAVKVSGTLGTPGEYTVEVTLKLPLVPSFASGRFPNNVGVASLGCAYIDITSSYTITVS